jgi:uncharacterized membrane protein YbhN (UPF0104 family)
MVRRARTVARPDRRLERVGGSPIDVRLTPTRRRWLVAAVGVVVSLVAAVIAVRGIDVELTWQLMVESDLRLLVLAVGVIGVQVLLRAGRWRLLLPVAPARRPGLGRVVPVLLIGYLGNAVLPARLGEAVRAAVLARREGLSTAETFGSVILERVLDTLALAVFALSAVAIVGLGSEFAPIGLLAIAAAVVAIAVLTAAPRFLAALRIGPFARVIDAVVAVMRGAQVTHRPVTVAAAIGLCLVAWALDAAIYLLAARALGIDLPVHGAIVISAVAALSTAIPSAPGFIGTLELAISTVAQAFGVAPSAALALAIVVHAVALLPVALSGVVAAVVVGRDGSLAGIGAGLESDRRPATSP